MKKWAIGVLSACTVAALGALALSYYSGGKIQTAFEHTAETWSTEDGLTVQLMEYDRGWLRSHAQTIWSFAREEDSYDIRVTHDIVHGPWPMGQAARITSRFELPQDSDPQLLQALQQRAMLEWVTTASWSGATRHTLSSPSFAVDFEDGSALPWGGLQGQWTLSASHDHAQGSVQMPALRASVDDGSLLDMADAGVQFDARLPLGHSFWEGPLTFQLGGLTLASPQDLRPFKLQQLRMESTTRLSDQRVAMGLQAQLALLETPAYSARDLAAEIQLQRIDAHWLDTWMRWAQTNGQDEAQTMALLHSLPDLLASQPELRIPRLSLQTPDGPATLSARLAYAGQQPDNFNPATDLEGHLSTQLPQSLVMQLLEARVRSDYLQLLEQLGHEMEEDQFQAAVNDGVGKRMKALIRQGVVQRRGDMFGAELEFSQGGFKLNGQPQPLQMLMGIGGAL